MTISDRKQEIKRRRHRRKKLAQFERRLARATFSEKSHLANKLRRLTPGAEEIIERWALVER